MPDIEACKTQVCFLMLYFDLRFSYSGLSLPVIILFCSMVDFFKELPQYLIKAGAILNQMYGADWKNKLEVVLE